MCSTELMSELTDRQLSAYLLGSLPAADAERIDELSVTDEAFAERLRAVEYDLVDAYDQGELLGADLKNFEGYYLNSPIRRNRANFAAAFHTFASVNADAATESTSALVSEKGLLSRIFEWPTLRLAFAAGLVLMTALGGWLFIENARLRGELDTASARAEDMERQAEVRRAQDPPGTVKLSDESVELARLRAEREELERKLARAQARPGIRPPARPADIPRRQAQSSIPRILSFVLTPPLRSSGQLPQISLPEDTDRAVIRLELESNELHSYAVELREPATDRVIWNTRKVTAVRSGDQSSITANIPARLLRRQIYTLSVTRSSSAGEREIVGDYTFRVVR